jgi:hypothetical protein
MAFEFKVRQAGVLEEISPQGTTYQGASSKEADPARPGEDDLATFVVEVDYRNPSLAYGPMLHDGS